MEHGWYSAKGNDLWFTYLQALSFNVATFGTSFFCFLPGVDSNKTCEICIKAPKSKWFLWHRMFPNTCLFYFSSYLMTVSSNTSCSFIVSLLSGSAVIVNMVDIKEIKTCSVVCSSCICVDLFCEGYLFRLAYQISEMNWKSVFFFFFCSHKYRVMSLKWCWSFFKGSSWSGSWKRQAAFQTHVLWNGAPPQWRGCHVSWCAQVGAILRIWAARKEIYREVYYTCSVKI